MTVRLIPTESDSTPPPHDPSPPEPSDGSMANPAGDVAPNPTPASPDEGPDGSSDDTSGEAPSSEAPSSEAPSTEAPSTQTESSVDSSELVKNGSGGADSRVALREARRLRRRVAWLCAAIVAICLALTIAVVSMARNRPAPTSGSVAWSALVVPSTGANGSMALPHEPFPGAPAPEGGNP